MRKWLLIQQQVAQDRNVRRSLPSCSLSDPPPEAEDKVRPMSTQITPTQKMPLERRGHSEENSPAVKRKQAHDEEERVKNQAADALVIDQWTCVILVSFQPHLVFVLYNGCEIVLLFTRFFFFFS